MGFPDVQLHISEKSLHEALGEIKPILYYLVLPRGPRSRWQTQQLIFLWSIYSRLSYAFPHCLGKKKHSHDYSVILSSCAKPVQGSNTDKSYYICPPNYLLTHTLCKVINFQWGSRKHITWIKLKYITFSRNRKKYMMF